MGPCTSEHLVPRPDPRLHPRLPAASMGEPEAEPAATAKPCRDRRTRPSPEGRGCPSAALAAVAGPRGDPAASQEGDPHGGASALVPRAVHDYPRTLRQDGGILRRSRTQPSRSVRALRLSVPALRAGSVPPALPRCGVGAGRAAPQKTPSGPRSPAKSPSLAATTPPGRVTRAIWVRPATGSAMKCTTRSASAASKESLGKGSASAAARATSTSGSLARTDPRRMPTDPQPTPRPQAAARATPRSARRCRSRHPAPASRVRRRRSPRMAPPGCANSGPCTRRRPQRTPRSSPVNGGRQFRAPSLAAAGCPTVVVERQPGGGLAELGCPHGGHDLTAAPGPGR